MIPWIRQEMMIEGDSGPTFADPEPAAGAGRVGKPRSKEEIEKAVSEARAKQANQAQTTTDATSTGGADVAKTEPKSEE